MVVCHNPSPQVLICFEKREEKEQGEHRRGLAHIIAQTFTPRRAESRLHGRPVGQKARAKQEKRGAQGRVWVRLVESKVARICADGNSISSERGVGGARASRFEICMQCKTPVER
jgi:hypothetical protein